MFGTITASGAFRVKDGKLQVKISKEGTTHGQWFGSDMLASDTSAIWHVRLEHSHTQPANIHCECCQHSLAFRPSDAPSANP